MERTSKCTLGPLDLLSKQPVKFTCECGTDWYVPPGNGCPNCGQDVARPATCDECVWEVGEVIPNLYVSAQFRDKPRFADICEDLDLGGVVDLAGRYPYLWKPTTNDLIEQGIHAYREFSVEDNLIQFAPEVLEDFVQHMRYSFDCGVTTLVHCAAGLRRAPHFCYAYLRSVGLGPVDAWDKVEQARPFVYMHTPYVNSIEAWLEYR